MTTILSPTKTCTKCGESKSRDSFYQNDRPGGFPRCKACTMADQKEYASRPEVKLQRRQYMYERHLLEQYGMSLDGYGDLYRYQSGLCAICWMPETAKGRSGDVKPLAVDHDHATSEVRGLLCHGCNQILGCAQDDPQRLLRAAAFLGGRDNF